MSLILQHSGNKNRTTTTKLEDLILYRRCDVSNQSSVIKTVKSLSPQRRKANDGNDLTSAARCP